jgi:hypothetical protein
MLLFFFEVVESGRLLGFLSEKANKKSRTPGAASLLITNHNLMKNKTT